MKRANPTRQRLTALGLLGLALLGYPLLGLPDGQWGGLPAHYSYLFSVWGGLIAVAARITERKGN